MEPERRWTYHHRDVIDFIQAAQAAAIPVSGLQFRPWPSAAPAQRDPSALEYYDQAILKPDIAFSVIFALFIAAAGLTIALWQAERVWVVYAGILATSLGIIYGAADIGEDLKLLGIFKHARETKADNSPDTEPAEAATGLADAAEVDAANALTRVKVSAIAASVIGGAAFGLLVVLDELAARWEG